MTDSLPSTDRVGEGFAYFRWASARCVITNCSVCWNDWKYGCRK